MRKIITFFLMLLISKTVMADGAADMKKLADAIQNCNAGNYNMNNPINGPGAVPMVIEIKGFQSDHCQINTTTIMPGGFTLMMNCRYSTSVLPIISQSLRDLSNGKTISSSDSASQITNKSCQQSQTQ